MGGDFICLYLPIKLRKEDKLSKKKNKNEEKKDRPGGERPQSF